jgi:predicted nucleic acid-binding protein
MRRWLVDTNVVSELRKPRCDAAVKAWSEAQAPELLYLSRITIAEIRFGIEQHAGQRFREKLQAWLDTELRPWFADRILEMDEEVILEWRRIVQPAKPRVTRSPSPTCSLRRRHRSPDCVSSPGTWPISCAPACQSSIPGPASSESVNAPVKR